MTDAQKLAKIQDLLDEYKDDDTLFEQPTNETTQQKNFREDLRAVVSLVFREDLNLPSHLSSRELKERLRKIWEETKKTMIFVTHSLTEAVLLSRRVIVLSEGPGIILKDIEIELGYPRDYEVMATEKFGRIRDSIRKLIA